MEILSFPINNGDLDHSYVTVYLSGHTLFPHSLEGLVRCLSQSTVQMRSIQYFLMLKSHEWGFHKWGTTIARWLINHGKSQLQVDDD